MKPPASVSAPLALFLSLGAVLVGIRPGSAQESGVGGSSPESRIVVEPIGGARWRATYRLQAPATRLEFQRPAGFFRQTVWEVVTPGYQLERDGDLQILALAEDAAPADRIVVEFGEYTEELSREYELFVKFSDGGRAIYSGHLYARPADARSADAPSADARSDADGMIRTLDIAPLDGERIVIRGGVYDAATTWTDAAGDGTYIYYGSTEPLETADVIAVLDRGLPEWLRDEFDTWLPRLFSLYRDRLGQALPWKPLVLYGHAASDQEGYNYGGGTLTGLIQLTVSGDSWTEPTPAGRELALGFLAHEVAHLWNGQLTTNNGSDSWTHEGSADAFADRLLREFGVLDDDGLRHRSEEALNSCFLRLEGRPIKLSTSPRTPYECGQVMALWTERALAAAGAGEDLLGFWNELIESSLENDGAYDAERYLGVLGELGVETGVRDRMRLVLEGEGDGGDEAVGGFDPVAVIVSGLRDAGVSIRTGGEAAPDYRRELARRAMGHVMASVCDGKFSYSGVRTFTTYPIEDCEPFEAGREVAEINGHPVADAGDAIYDSVVETCAVGGEIGLAGTRGTPDLRVTCGRELAARPPWFSIGETR